MPKISVIVPIYNTEKYLPKCLDSLTGQTLKDIEIICVNDCSTDNSFQILQKYAVNDDRIKIIDLKENTGAAVARNKGIDEANGEYIGFVDSDDFVDEDFYEKLYNKAVETGADTVKGNIYNFDETTGKVELTDFYNKNDEIQENSVYFLYGFTSAIYRTNFIKQNKICFPEGITHFEDPYFSIGVTLHRPLISIVDDTKYFYFRHKESTCANCKTLQQTRAFIRSIDLILNMINQGNVSEQDYGIYVCFLIQQVIPWCSDLSLTDEANIEACNGFIHILNNSKFSKDNLIKIYFLGQKERKRRALKKNKEDLLKKLRRNMKG